MSKPPPGCVLLLITHGPWFVLHISGKGCGIPCEEEAGSQEAIPDSGIHSYAPQSSQWLIATHPLLFIMWCEVQWEQAMGILTSDRVSVCGMCRIWGLFVALELVCPDINDRKGD